MQKVIVFFLSFLAPFTDTCVATRSNAPIVCPCNTDEVALLNDINGVPGAANSIQPVGTVATQDRNNCPTVYTITCSGTNGRTVYMEFQDNLSGAIQTESLNVTCTNGNWIYNGGLNGDMLVVSVQCQQT